MWLQKCDGGPYNGADSVHWPFIYIYNGKSSISKKESDACLCTMAIHWTLSDDQLDFENLIQSEAREPPTSGCKSMVEGLTIMPRVFINLLYTHTMPNNHYCSTYMMPYPHLMAKHCLTISRKSRFLA